MHFSFPMRVSSPVLLTVKLYANTNTSVKPGIRPASVTLLKCTCFTQLTVSIFWHQVTIPHYREWHSITKRASGPYKNLSVGREVKTNDLHQRPRASDGLKDNTLQETAAISKRVYNVCSPIWSFESSSAWMPSATHFSTTCDECVTRIYHNHCTHSDITAWNLSTFAWGTLCIIARREHK
jgi:hypothetical protein